MTATLRPRLALAFTLFVIAFSFGTLSAGAAEPVRKNFDHLLTGFPLTGQHAQAPCEACHVGGLFKGTPKQCAVCHSRGSRILATPKPANHVPTFSPCEECHRSSATWTGARFSHMTVAPNTCMTCHNGVMAPGKSAGHIVTNASCDSCHRTVAWVPAGFNHAGVMPGTCATCHGVTATGKPPGHMPTTASCDTCHRTTAWRPALAVDHSTVVPGTCASCHNGTTARGMPGGHFVTTRSCDACHRTSAWLPVITYSHTSPAYRPHNTGVTCLRCHTTNTEVATWNFATYKPDCAGCHAGNFKPDSHKKTESPATILYTVAELKDCSGSCHLYTNNTFTTILQSRTGQHRSTDGGF